MVAGIVVSCSMEQSIHTRLLAMRDYFNRGTTQPLAFRKQQLILLKHAIQRHEQEIYAALHADLGKSAEECWVTENGFVLNELDYTIRNLGGWMEPRPVATNLLNLPSKSRIIHEPLGIVLIIAPWNYPFQLLMAPLIGAMAAGNCVVLKPSEFAPATSVVMEKIISSIYDPAYIQYITGEGAVVIPDMMDHFRFDHVFYTGSTQVGKIIYQLAAKQLVPVTLELGGKSPCVVESDADLSVAANRITVTKFSNAGQMCIAPDYVLVHSSVKDKLMQLIRERIIRFFTEQPQQSGDYCRIINEKQFNRLLSYLDQGRIFHGGEHDISQKYIAPTLIDEVTMNSPIMQDEIFGPILPFIPFQTMEEAQQIIAQNPDPLAFYLFTKDTKKEEAWLQAVPSGAACINNASWHATNHHLPFGGRGNSGIGNYHGQFSFHTFSHAKAVLKTPVWFDPAMKYPPFGGKLWLFKKFV